MACSNKNGKSIKNLIRLVKKELKDLQIHDLLSDPKLQEAYRCAEPKHWSELTEDERKTQAKEQAEAEQEFVRKQKLLRVKQLFQSIMKAKCDEPNSRLFTTAEELLEFVVKYESSPSSVSNYEWNKFETILLTRLESLLQADGKEEEPTETEQGNIETKGKSEGMIEFAYAMIISMPDVTVKKTPKIIGYHIILNYGEEDGILDVVYCYDVKTYEYLGVRIDKIPKNRGVLLMISPQANDYFTVANNIDTNEPMIIFSKTNPFEARVLANN